MATALSIVTGAPAAQAAPICPGASEALTVDAAGRACTTDPFSGRVYRFDAPGAPPVAIATVPGGGAGAPAWSPGGAAESVRPW